MAVSSADVALRWEDSEAERDHNGLLARPQEDRRPGLYHFCLCLFCY